MVHMIVIVCWMLPSKQMVHDLVHLLVYYSADFLWGEGLSEGSIFFIGCQ